MKKKINNIEQLRAEIKKAKEDVRMREAQLHRRAMQIQESLKPENVVLRIISSITGINIDKAEFFKDGAAIGLSLFLQRFIFKTEKSMERKIYHWLDELFDRVKSVINKFSHHGDVGSEKIEEEEDN